MDSGQGLLTPSGGHDRQIHAAAPHHLPPSPGETDILMMVMTGVLLVAVLLVGVLYVRLHALPEHMAIP